LKYRVWTFLLIVISVLIANVAVAQEDKSVADEFEAFKKKLQTAQGLQPDEMPTAPQPAAAAITVNTPAAIPVTNPSPVSGYQSPLGNIPIGASSAVVVSPLTNNI